MRRVCTSPRRGMAVLAVVALLGLCGHPDMAVSARSQDPNSAGSQFFLEARCGGIAAHVADQGMTPQVSPPVPASPVSPDRKSDPGTGSPPDDDAPDPTGSLLDDSGSMDWEL
jgi:hypothetical protein